MKTHVQRCTAWAIATLLMLATAPIAFADPEPTHQAAHHAVNKELIDAHRRGSLSIHKSVGDPRTQFGDPHNPSANVDRAPIAGVRFRVRRVISIDVTTSEGWLAAEKLTPADFYAGGAHEHHLSPHPEVAVTGADGVARLSNLPLGLYYVVQEPGAQHERNVTVAAPFLVMVPTTDPVSRDRWLYDLQVYAKDQPLTATTHVDRTCAEVGDTMRYTVVSNAPAPDRDGRLRRYTIANPLPEQVQFSEGSVEIMLGEGSKATKLAATDFTFTIDAHRVATAELTTTGLAKLAALRAGNPDLTVTTSFDVTVTGEPSGGYLRDVGYLLTEGYPQFDVAIRPGVNSNEVSTAIPCGGVRPPKIFAQLAAHTPTPPVSQAAQQQSAKGGKKLAMTGSPGLWVVGVGMVLVLGGVVLLRRTRTR